jgi:hypothetical protein
LPLESTVYFRLLGYGATGSAGTFYLGDLGNTTGVDFGLNGKLSTSVAASGFGTLGIDTAGTSTFSGSITNNNTATLTAASGGTANFNGIISGAGTINKTGAGVVSLAATNTYTGTTTVSAGTLNIASAGSIASSDVTVANAATLKATNSYTSSSLPASAIIGAITLNSGASIDLTAGSLKGTTLTVAALSGADVTNISYTLGNTLALTGAPTLNGNLNLTVDGTSAVAGTNNLITWSGSKSGAGSFTSTLNSTPAGLRGVLKTSSAAVSADYYTLATADASQTVNVGNVRVGVNKTAALTLTNKSASGTYSENLTTNGFSNTSSGFTATGTAAIGAGSSGSGTLAVGITATAAGAQSGSTTLALQSTAVNSSGLSAYNLSSQAITITGTAYDLASPTYSTTTKAFGNVRAGATVSSQNINFANTTITNASYQDSLDVSGSKTNSAITLGNGFNVAAGNNANLSVSANTATAGSLNDTITLSLTSNANGVSGLSNSSITPSGTVAVTGAVYDLASPTYATTAKAFGNVRTGATVSSQNINFANTTITNASYQDSLDVSGSKTNSAITLGNGFKVAAGNNANLSVSANTATAGSLNDTITLSLTSNANGVSDLSNSSITPSGTVAVTGAVYDQLAQPTQPLPRHLVMFVLVLMYRLRTSTSLTPRLLTLPTKIA